MRDKIFDFISERYQSSGGNCGVYLTELRKEFEMTSQDLSDILNILFIEGKIKVSFGIHGKMAMLNKEKIRFFKSNKIRK